MGAFNQFPDTDDVSLIGGKPGYVSENLVHPKWMIFVPKGDNIATYAASILKATYTATILATSGIWYKSPLIIEGAETTSDAEKKEFSSGHFRTLPTGNYAFDFMFDVKNAIAANLFTLNNKLFDVYIIWNDNIIEGRKDETGTIFWPLRVQELSINQKTIPFKDTMVVKGTITLSDRDDRQKNSVLIKPTAFDFSTIESKRPVTISAVATGASYIVTVTVLDNVGEGVEGLLEAQFTVTGGTTAVFSETGNGIYSFTMTNGTVSTYNLVSAALLYAAIDDYIESTGVTGSITPTTA